MVDSSVTIVAIAKDVEDDANILLHNDCERDTGDGWADARLHVLAALAMACLGLDRDGQPNPGPDIGWARGDLPPVVWILRAVDLVTHQTDGDQNGCGRTDQDDEFPAGNGGYDTDHGGRGGRRV
jgi:hypothetical protein